MPKNNVYAAEPDKRQSDDVAMPTTRFRPRYRALEPDEIALHDAIKSKAEELEKLIEQVKPGKPTRYKSLAITDLESAVIWAVKELTA